MTGTGFGRRAAALAATLTLTIIGVQTAFMTPALAQQRRLDYRHMGERIVLIVPMIGTGTADDPRRPLFAPRPEQMGPDGITGYRVAVSDDKRTALIELVAHSRKAFEEVFKETRVDVKKFDPVKGAKKEDIETEFRKVKKDFDFAKFREGN